MAKSLFGPIFLFAIFFTFGVANVFHCTFRLRSRCRSVFFFLCYSLRKRKAQKQHNRHNNEWIKKQVSEKISAPNQNNNNDGGNDGKLNRKFVKKLPKHTHKHNAQDKYLSSLALKTDLHQFFILLNSFAIFFFRFISFARLRSLRKWKYCVFIVSLSLCVSKWIRTVFFFYKICRENKSNG